VDEVPEEVLEAGERRATAHRHDDVSVTDDALDRHLEEDHGTAAPEGLSFGALRGMHDRFHDEAHAADD
jgi:hypothetical protein